MQTKILIVAFVLIIATAGAWFYYASTKDAPSLLSDSETQTEETTVVATVNGEEITRVQLETLKTQVGAQQGIDLTMLDEPTLAQFNTQILESLISQALLRQAAANADIQVPAEEIDAQIATITQQFENTEAYEQALSAEGLTDASLRAQIEVDLKTQAYLEQELQLSTLTATEEEINTTYAEVGAGQEVPPLTEVYAQVESMVIEQKQQERIAGLLETLSAGAQIERTL